MLPVRWKEQVGVLIADLSQVADQSDLSMLMHTELMPVLTIRSEINRCIEACYFKRTDSAQDFIRDLDQQQRQADQPEKKPGRDDLLNTVSSAPVTQLVNLMLLEAVRQNASDIHLEPRDERLRVRYRIDGRLYEQAEPPKHMEAALISRLKVMGQLDIAEKRLPQDGMATVHIGQREVDIRISTIPVAGGERVVLRLLNTEQLARPLSDLGMPPGINAQLELLLLENRGAVWVTGPTGSGKTTTLYAALSALDTNRRNVLTIEDPIEYRLADVGQMAVKPKIGLTFAQGLRHILRQDPDVILVGETRDLETAEIAIRASLTGHLVFSTLHTNDAAGAIVRLVDMGIPPYLAGAATRAVIAQRLLRCLCPHCRKTLDTVPDLPERWQKQLDGVELFTPVGCGRCLEGYAGRVGVYELILMDDELQSIIRQGADEERIADYLKQRQVPTLLDDALEKVRNGQTDVAEVMRVLGRM